MTPLRNLDIYTATPVDSGVASANAPARPATSVLRSAGRVGASIPSRFGVGEVTNPGGNPLSQPAAVRAANTLRAVIRARDWQPFDFGTDVA